MSSPHSSEEEEVGDVEDPEVEEERLAWLKHIFHSGQLEYHPPPTRKLFRGEPTISYIDTLNLLRISVVWSWLLF